VIGLGAECFSDSMCSSFCCSNDKEYKNNGTCVLVANNSRCTQRKENDLIILITCYAVLIPLLGLCAYIKIKKIKSHQEYLNVLRMKSIA
jgi:hypothetical protein